MAKVIVYTTKTCPWCKKTKEFLKARKIRFTEKDVGKSKRAAEEAVKKSGQQGVPVIEIDGKVTVGFNEEDLKKMLEIK